jgi:hypothetical protein
MCNQTREGAKIRIRISVAPLFGHPMFDYNGFEINVNNKTCKTKRLKIFYETSRTRKTYTMDFA